jgi:hypothetical protein
MDITAITRWLGAEWAVIAHAPLTFLACLVVMGILIWKALQWQFAARLENARDALALRDVQLQAYQGGAGLDEVSARMDAIEDRIDAMVSGRVALAEVMFLAGQGSEEVPGPGPSRKRVGRRSEQGSSHHPRPLL